MRKGGSVSMAMRMARYVDPQITYTAAKARRIQRRPEERSSRTADKIAGGAQASSEMRRRGPGFEACLPERLNLLEEGRSSILGGFEDRVLRYGLLSIQIRDGPSHAKDPVAGPGRETQGQSRRREGVSRSRG
jgi:hypothetical protein